MKSFRRFAASAISPARHGKTSGQQHHRMFFVGPIQADKRGKRFVRDEAAISALELPDHTQRRLDLVTSPTFQCGWTLDVERPSSPGYGRFRHIAGSLAAAQMRRHWLPGLTKRDKTRQNTVRQRAFLLFSPEDGGKWRRKPDFQLACESSFRDTSMPRRTLDRCPMAAG